MVMVVVILFGDKKQGKKRPHLMQPARRGMCASTRAVYWMSMSDSATMMLLRTTGKGDLPSSCARHATAQHSTTYRRQTRHAVAAVSFLTGLLP